MKHHFTYKLTMTVVVLAAAFVFAACGTDTVPESQEPTAAPAQESPEASQAAEKSDTMDGQSATSEESAADDEQSMDGQKVFTLEELSEYDGKDGRPAYVAVDGVVYDVSDKPLWAGGEHQNRVSAGRDLSEAILSSPHGKAKLEELPVVGILAEE